jgi:hypothetical protein
MSSRRPPISGRDVAGAGAPLLSVNLVCAGIGAGIGALVDVVIPLMLAGFFIGFFLGIYVVARRFHDL